MLSAETLYLDCLIDHQMRQFVLPFKSFVAYLAARTQIYTNTCIYLFANLTIFITNKVIYWINGICVTQIKLNSLLALRSADSVVRFLSRTLLSNYIEIHVIVAFKNFRIFLLCIILTLYVMLATFFLHQLVTTRTSIAAVLSAWNWVSILTALEFLVKEKAFWALLPHRTRIGNPGTKITAIEVAATSGLVPHKLVTYCQFLGATRVFRVRMFFTRNQRLLYAITWHHIVVQSCIAHVRFRNTRSAGDILIAVKFVLNFDTFGHNLAQLIRGITRRTALVHARLQCLVEVLVSGANALVDSCSLIALIPVGTVESISNISRCFAAAWRFAICVALFKRCSAFFIAQIE